MGTRRSVYAVIVAAAALGLLRISVVGISDPSEGRYAEIARAMADSGDWVVPRHHTVPHLEKPPLAYWAGAIGIRLFGRNEFGIRFVPLLALLASAVLAAGIARRLAGPRAAAPTAAALSLTFYPVAIGEALLTDVFVLFAAALFLHSIVRRMVDGDRRAMGWTGVALAIGFMAKGHVVFLFTVLPLLFARTGLVRELVRPVPVLVFLALTTPWFVAVQQRYPRFWSIHGAKLLDFVGESRQHHHAPFFVYFAVLAFGLMPFPLVVRSGLRDLAPGPRRLLLAMLLVPLVALTLIPSRSWTYILPATPPLAVLLGRGVARAGLGRRHGWRRIALAAGALACVALIGISPLSPALARNVDRPIIAGVAFLVSFVLVLRVRRPLVEASVLAVCFSGAMIVAAYVDEPAFKIHRRLARRLDAEAERGRQIALVGASRSSIAFYVRKPVTVYGFESTLDTEARNWGAGPRYHMKTELPAMLRDPRRLIVMTEQVREERVPDRKPWLRYGSVVVLGEPSDEAP